MKPFNLEEAEAGKPLCTRDGRDARIVTQRYHNHEFPLGVIVTGHNGSEEFNCYTLTGSYSGTSTGSHYDLFMKTQNKEHWVNVYRTPLGRVHTGRTFHSEAVACGQKDNLMGEYLTTVKIYEEEV